MTPDSLLELVVDGSRAVVWIAGEIDLANSAELLKVSTTALADAAVDEVLLDVSAVTFMDSTGLGALVQLRNRAGEVGKRVSLRGVTPPVGQVLAITHLDVLFGVGPGDAGRC